MSAPSWQEAERVAGRRLDRRRTYAIIEGEVFEQVRYSAACSGCDSSGEYEIADRGSGCEECGYTGRRRRCEGVPVDLSQPADGADLLATGGAT